MTYVIGVLPSNQNGYAEEQIISAGKRKNLDIVLIDPFTITLGVQPDSIRHHEKAMICDGIISCCEISSSLAPEWEARLRLLQFYENQRIPIINSSPAVIKCRDKFIAHYHLSKCGVSTPKTFVTYEYQVAEKLLLDGELEFPVVIKKIYYVGGESIYKIDSLSELKAVYEKHFAPGEVLFLQEFLDLEVSGDGDVRDYRVWVIREKPESGKARILGAVYRNARAGNFQTDAGHGGYVSPILDLPNELSELSEKALGAVSADAAAVNIARTKNGKLFVMGIKTNFDVGRKSRIYIGNIWTEVFDLLVSKIELKRGNMVETSLSARN